MAPGYGIGVDIQAVNADVRIRREQPAEGSSAAAAEIQDFAAG